MAKKHSAYKTPSQAKAKAPASTPKKAPARRLALRPLYAKVLLFLLLYVFCTFIYGDVFARAEQESFINSDAVSMKFLTDKSWGSLYLFGRWLLLAFKSKWVGGLLLSAVLTATACQIDYILRLPARWRNVSFLVPLAELGWMVSLGLNLWYKEEPSRIVLVPLAVFFVLFAGALVCRLLRRGKPAPCTLAGNALPGFLVALVAWGGLTGYACYAQQNTILVSRMQLRLQQQDWEGIIADGLSARKPSRAVAAYYAIGLLREGQLLDGLFDIPYNYPNNYLRNHHSGNEEYGLLQVDADFHAGLPQTAYHYALEFNVMNGTTLYNTKRMAVCALLTEEYELARKYLHIVERVPFESSFVEKYRAMADDPKLIDEDPELAAIKKLLPRESKFEQNYRQPTFLGYNVGLAEGTDETLTTSIAACLYSKDLRALVPRLQVLVQQGKPLPIVAQQAMACLSIKQPEVLNIFPMSQFTKADLEAFLTDARPYAQDKDKLRKELKERWLGNYFYYYYCENNDSIATGKANQGSSNSGVN